MPPPVNVLGYYSIVVRWHGALAAALICFALAGCCTTGGGSSPAESETGLKLYLVEDQTLIRVTGHACQVGSDVIVSQSLAKHFHHVTAVDLHAGWDKDSRILDQNSHFRVWQRTTPWVTNFGAPGQPALELAVAMRSAVVDGFSRGTWCDVSPLPYRQVWGSGALAVVEFEFRDPKADAVGASVSSYRVSVSFVVMPATEESVEGTLDGLHVCVPCQLDSSRVWLFDAKSSKAFLDAYVRMYESHD